MSGEIAIGPFVVQVGDAAGAVLREARRSERAHFRPRPAPVMIRPRAPRPLIDRRTEMAAALSAIDAGLPVEVSGGPGVGKTALLRHLAHHPRASSFVDGIVCLSARHCTGLDLLQRLFEAFYESDTTCRPTDAEIRRALQDKHALILLDDVDLAQKEVEAALDAAPRSAFVIASQERCLWGEVRAIASTGLPPEDGVLLLERELERSLEAGEQAAATALSAALGGHPRRLMQAAADIRRNAIPAAGWSRYSTADDLVIELLASLDDKGRRVLFALSALSGVSVDARHVSGLAELTDVEPALAALVERGLVLTGQSRYRLADGVADRLRRSGDLAPWVHRAVTYFTAWAERQRRNDDMLVEASDALVRVQEHATDTRRWGEALRLGSLLEPALIVSARWGAWELVLDRCLAAAKALADRPVEARTLHQMGTRAVCLGDEGNARRLLTRAAALREELGEHVAAAISRRNLGFVPAAVAIPVAAAAMPVAPAVVIAEPVAIAAPVAVVDDSRGGSARVASPSPAAPAFDSLPFRSHAETVAPERYPSGAGPLLVVFLICAILGGLAYAGVFSDLGWSLSREPASQAADAASAAPPLRETTEVVRRPAPDAPIAQRANILIFTARPGSIASSRATSLCYAVRDAAQARIEPSVGDVDPAGTLTCRRVAPSQTTTYELTATGRDGIPVSQHVVIVVR